VGTDTGAGAGADAGAGAGAGAGKSISGISKTSWFTTLTKSAVIYGNC